MVKLKKCSRKSVDFSFNIYLLEITFKLEIYQVDVRVPSRTAGIYHPTLE